ncbi:thermonuclease family protein [Ferruginivarius sediminum]|uniref:thermonuclease family protein n=1 Tax=Ferruginivarius sediminum TaxID=2661937 RepID=UPI0011C0343A|nr:nuclease-like protein [Ferruginivarius sediminum]
MRARTTSTPSSSGAHKRGFRLSPELRRSRHGLPLRRFAAVLGTFALILGSAAPAASEFRSYALVQPDATLKVAGRHVRLWGIFIPDSGQECLTLFNPPRCGTRAAIALEQRIQRFVTCEIQGRDRDGMPLAICREGMTKFDPGEDLAAYLLREGWAVAAPYAPFEYHTLERIARTRGFGIWGFQVESVR